MSERVRSLDVLRGVALLGILPANIPYFGLPAALGRVDRGFAYHATRLFFDYKFITIFSLLFGVGIALQRRSAERSGRSFGWTMTRRLLVLWIFGIAHAVLLWYGDIVSYYAPLGLLLFWASGARPRRLAIAGSILIAIPIVGMGTVAPLISLRPDRPPASWLSATEVPRGDAAAARRAVHGSDREFLEALQPPGPELERAVFREGSYGRVTIFRAVLWIGGLFEWGWYIGWRIAGLFLLGMALAGTGWLSAPVDRGRVLRVAAIGMAVGLPLHVGSSFLAGTAPVSTARDLWAELLLYAGSLASAAAYVALVGLATAGGVPRVLRPLEAIGRTAFSNYLLQSLLCTLFFYSYGLARFDTLDSLDLWLVVAAVWAVQLVVSPLWLSAFAAGPVEWLWRTLTYWRFQPIRRPAP